MRKKVIKAFEKKNPNIKVKLETIDFTSGPEKSLQRLKQGQHLMCFLMHQDELFNMVKMVN